ncbi:MAG: hypothetical protein H5T69_17790, partial [Chloroflexi bacterium]|nr:hypothetical protein [Chloroflexota bacterium]
GGQPNRLKVVCRGPEMEFYANGHLLTKVHEATYPLGCVGLLAGSALDGDIDVRFDNLLVEALTIS